MSIMIKREIGALAYRVDGLAYRMDALSRELEEFETETYVMISDLEEKIARISKHLQRSRKR